MNVYQCGYMYMCKACAKASTKTQLTLWPPCFRPKLWGLGNAIPAPGRDQNT